MANQLPGADMVMDNALASASSNMQAGGAYMQQQPPQALNMLDVNPPSQLPMDPLLSSQQLGGLGGADFDAGIPPMNTNPQDRLNYAAAL